MLPGINPKRAFVKPTAGPLKPVLVLAFWTFRVLTASRLRASVLLPKFVLPSILSDITKGV